MYSDLHVLQVPHALYRTMCPEYISLLLFSVVIISDQPFIALYVYSSMQIVSPIIIIYGLLRIRDILSANGHNIFTVSNGVAMIHRYISYVYSVL